MPSGAAELAPPFRAVRQYVAHARDAPRRHDPSTCAEMSVALARHTEHSCACQLHILKHAVCARRMRLRYPLTLLACQRLQLSLALSADGVAPGISNPLLLAHPVLLLLGTYISRYDVPS